MRDIMECNESDIDLKRIEEYALILKKFYLKPKLIEYVTEDVYNKLIMKVSACKYDDESFNIWLGKLVDEKKLKRREIIQNSDIDGTYYNHLLNRRRKPSRDKAIQLCFGLRLTENESIILLRKAGYAALSHDCCRDYAISLALNEKFKLIEANILLGRLKLAPIKPFRINSDSDK
jgi:hypothetical protein